MQQQKEDQPQETASELNLARIASLELAINRLEEENRLIKE